MATSARKKGLNPARITVYTTDYAGNTSMNYVEIGPRSMTLENLSLAVGGNGADCLYHPPGQAFLHSSYLDQLQ